MHLFSTKANARTAEKMPVFHRGGRSLTVAALMLILGMLFTGASLQAAEPGKAQPAGTSGFIQGTVTDATAAALAGVTIQISLQSNGTLMAEVTTDSNGNFGPVELAPDNYTVEATKQFYHSFATDVALGTNETETIAIALERGSGFLQGDVSDETASPIEGASIVVVDLSDGSVTAQLISASNGSFGPTELPAANYAVTIDHPEYVASSNQITLEVNETQTVTAVLLDKVIFKSRFETDS